MYGCTCINRIHTVKDDRSTVYWKHETYRRHIQLPCSIGSASCRLFLCMPCAFLLSHPPSCDSRSTAIRTLPVSAPLRRKQAPRRIPTTESIAYNGNEGRYCCCKQNRYSSSRVQQKKIKKYPAQDDHNHLRGKYKPRGEWKTNATSITIAQKDSTICKQDFFSRWHVCGSGSGTSFSNRK